ncbi:O-acetylhomoserine aminocarboxypropyltransferase/cysteine synthase [candidate division KSB1 bacterium]|nr:O-acetylhomoserine aminocarboxypropyltransferase/cysteine synthase [candidate division KSB1 bacterium]
MKVSAEELAKYQTQTPKNEAPPLQEPIAMTVTYKFASLKHCIDTFRGDVKSHAYTRISNPTVEAFEEKVRALSSGICAVAFSSGTAALANLFFALGYPGANIITSPKLYGGTIALFDMLRAFGVEIRFVDFNNLDAVEKHIDDKTCLIFTEAIANPLMEIIDFEAVYRVAQRHQVIYVIDNTNSVALFDALRWCDVEALSATKYIGGHGNAVGGMIVCGPFQLSRARYPKFYEPSNDLNGKTASEAGGDAALPLFLRCTMLRNFGSSLSPFNAYLFLNGMETLRLRMDHLSSKSLMLAKWLQAQPQVKTVCYPDLNSNAALLDKYFPGGTGGLLSFSLHGGWKEVERLFNRLSTIQIAANIGDCKTILQHVGCTSHNQLDSKQLAEFGIEKNLLRLSVGLEPLEVIQADLQHALQ